MRAIGMTVGTAMPVRIVAAVMAAARKRDPE
jgi:hypothetical protein